MSETVHMTNQELDDLFEKYRRSPNGYVFVPLADAVRKMGRAGEALEICEKGLAHHTGYASGHVVKGKCLYDLGRDGEAIETFDAVLHMDEHNLVALKYLGMIEARGGRFDSARGFFNHILRLDPENREIKHVLHEVNEREEFAGAAAQGSDEESGATGGRAEGTAADSDPETSEELATMTLADIFLSQGYKEKALRIYEEILSRQPGNRVVKQRVATLKAGASVEVTAEPADDVQIDGRSETGFEEIAPGPTGNEPARQGGKRETPADGKKTRLVEPEVLQRPPADRLIDQDKDIEHFKSWLGRVRQ